MSIPEIVYKLALLNVTMTVIGVGMLDFFFWITGHETISAWLRTDLEWFDHPALVMLVFLTLLFLHLTSRGPDTW